jgi:hypothetical protein
MVYCKKMPRNQKEQRTWCIVKRRAYLVQIPPQMLSEIEKKSVGKKYLGIELCVI